MKSRRAFPATVEETMNKLTRAGAALALTALMLLPTGCAYFYPEEQAQLEVPLSLGSSVNYTTVKVERGDLVRTLTFSARFSAVDKYDAYFTNGGGKIEKIYANVGSSVQEGDILLELNNDEALFQLEQAKIQLEIQTLQLDETKRWNGVNSVAYKTGELNLQIAQMKVDRLEQQANDCYLYAPVSGEVTFRKKDLAIGDNVVAYDPLFVIADNSQIQLVCTDAAANQLSVGQTVSVQIRRGSRPGFGGNNSLTGRVVQTPASSPTGSGDAEKVPAIIALDELTESQVIALYGQDAAISAEMEAREDVLYLPVDAVKVNGTQRYVRVLNEDNSVIEKSVTTGLTINSMVEITSGVEEGEVVILK